MLLESNIILYFLDSKPARPHLPPSIEFSYTEFHAFKVSWNITSDSAYSSTNECQSYTTFIILVQSFENVIYYMVSCNSCYDFIHRSPNTNYILICNNVNYGLSFFCTVASNLDTALRSTGP